MTIAEEVARRCGGADAYTLAEGYAVHGAKRVLFPAGRTEAERRNEKGRVTFARCRYADGSALVYTYQQNGATKLRALKAGKG